MTAHEAFLEALALSRAIERTQREAFGERDEERRWRRALHLSRGAMEARLERARKGAG